MILRPMFNVKRGVIPSIYRPHYVWETIEQCRERLNIEIGKREYIIKESPISIDRFNVWFISNNNLERMEIYKKYKIL